PGQEHAVLDHAHAPFLLADEDAPVGGDGHRRGADEPGGDLALGEAGGEGRGRGRRGDGAPGGGPEGEERGPETPREGTRDARIERRRRRRRDTSGDPGRAAAPERTSGPLLVVGGLGETRVKVIAENVVEKSGRGRRGYEQHLARASSRGAPC